MCTTTWTTARPMTVKREDATSGTTWPITSQNGTAVRTTARTKPVM